MAVFFPRISITVDNGHEHESQGELGSLAFGFGIHLTWTFCILFSPQVLYGTSSDTSYFGTPFFLTTLLVFAAAGLFLYITDQKFLKFYTSRNVLILSGVVCVLGSLASIASGFFNAGPLPALLSGIVVGCGCALLAVLWGTAFSRYNTASIVLNTSVAIVIATLLYSLIIHILPWPSCGILASLFPVFELPLLWRLTPTSYSSRHEVPIFSALPIKKVKFMLFFSPPLLLFGIVLGALKDLSLNTVLPSSNPTVQLIALFAGGTAAIVLVVLSFSTDKHYRWDFLFRPLIPIIALTLLFIPWLAEDPAVLPSLLMLTGYLCLESLLWIFLGQLSQEFRLSPICVFGIGSVAISLGTLIGTYSVENPWVFDMLPYGSGSLEVILLMILLVGISLLPRIHDLKRFIVPEAAGKNSDLGEVQGQINQGQSVLKTPGVPAWSAGLNLAMAQDPYFTLAQGASIAGEPQALSWEHQHIESNEASSVGLPTDKESDAARAKVRGRFRSQCEEIANRYLLSRRETEVMFFLAKGYNAAYIQDKLCISKSTAKTHISHIYRKLDIHNQQELLAMVDAGRAEDQPETQASPSAPSTKGVTA